MQTVRTKVAHFEQPPGKAKAREGLHPSHMGIPPLIGWKNHMVWDVKRRHPIFSTIQEKLQNLGIGPAKPPEPDLTEMLKTHTPSQVAVTGLTAPEITEKDIATKLKGEVSELKNLSNVEHVGILPSLHQAFGTQCTSSTGRFLHRE